MKLKIIRIACLLLTVVLVLGSCEYETIITDDIEIPDGVSFSDDIIPIFDSSCNTTGCHSAGHFAVDLTPENAYQDMFDKGMINLTDPANSPLYTKLVNPGSHDGRSTPTEQQIILKWIEEGAKNN